MKRRKPNLNLNYGSRRSDKYIRCYYKSELNVFRVEVELHSKLLRDISTLDDFPFLAEVIYPKHLQVVDLDWDRLKCHLLNRFGDDGGRIVAGVQHRSGSLPRLRKYLKRKGVVNVHRFLTPLPINDAVSRALDRWALHFKKDAV